jgi:hypothetical protein
MNSGKAPKYTNTGNVSLRGLQRANPQPHLGLSLYAACQSLEQASNPVQTSRYTVPSGIPNAGYVMSSDVQAA